MRKPQVTLMAILAAVLLAVSMAGAQTNLAERSELSELERKVDQLENRRETAAGGCGLAVLFGAFCALWAQNTGRNPWLWFFLGALLSVFTVLALLYQNAMDLKERRSVPPPASLPGPEPRA